jgi:quercetin dioxygenase-like cupin family protein
MSPTITRQFLSGSNTMLARILLKQGAHVPLHHHANEQIAYILSGRLKFILHEASFGAAPEPSQAAPITTSFPREVILGPGEILCIPPNLPHEAFALEDTIDLDIFTPPRQDWITGDDAYLRG